MILILLKHINNIKWLKFNLFDDDRHAIQYKKRSMAYNIYEHLSLHVSHMSCICKTRTLQNQIGHARICE